MSRLDIVAEMLVERSRQDKKWGVQNHPSIIDPDRWGAHYDYGIPSEAAAKQACDDAAKFGEQTWASIAIEELSESVYAVNDELRREELIQLAAVALAWIECIDRRESERSGAV